VRGGGHNQAEQTVHQRLRGLQNVINLDQLGLVVLHVLDELADSVVRAVDLLLNKLFGKVFSEEGGEGGAGDVLGGEAEDVSDLFARIDLGRLGILESRKTF